MSHMHFRSMAPGTALNLPAYKRKQQDVSFSYSLILPTAKLWCILVFSMSNAYFNLLVGSIIQFTFD
jgi:hypothetical protein